MSKALVGCLVLLSISGAGLTALGFIWAGQLVWAVSNLGLAIHNKLIGQRAQAWLFACFQVLAVIGICNHWPWG